MTTLFEVNYGYDAAGGRRYTRDMVATDHSELYTHEPTARNAGAAAPSGQEANRHAIACPTWLFDLKCGLFDGVVWATAGAVVGARGGPWAAAGAGLVGFGAGFVAGGMTPAEKAAAVGAVGTAVGAVGDALGAVGDALNPFPAPPQLGPDLCPPLPPPIDGYVDDQGNLIVYPPGDPDVDLGGFKPPAPLGPAGVRTSG